MKELLNIKEIEKISPLNVTSYAIISDHVEKSKWN
jgi:hypothetical protein